MGVYDLGNAALVASTVLVWCWILAYGLRVRWHRAEVGRHMMGISLVAGLVLALATIRILAGPWPGYEWLRLALYVAVLAAIAQHLTMFVRVQRRHRDRR